MSVESVSQRLKSLKIEHILNPNLSEYSHSKTGGIIPIMVFPRNTEQLMSVISELQQLEDRFIILGGMTNVVVASGNLHFNVINMSKFINEPILDTKDCIVTVSAGYEMKQLSQWAMENSLNGLQWMEGIPGTVGGGVFMNAGFLPGQDFQNVLIDAQVLMPDMSVKTITNKEMNYSYRKSIIQQNGGIVLSARLLLRRGKKWKIALRMAQYHRRRAKNQPLDLPSAGTVFIPPKPYHVGGLLPKMGLVGHRIGGAEISPKSPGFIVGVDHMTGEDYYGEVKFIQKSIKEKYGINVEPEVRLLGFKDATSK